MKNIITLFLLFIAILSFSQTFDSLKKNAFYIGVSVSPDYCYKIPIGNLKNPYIVSEKSLFSFSGGINVLKKFNKRIGLETAIWYSTKGESISTSSYTWITPGGIYDPAIPGSGSSTSINVPKKNTQYTYQYLEIPLKLNIYLLTKKIKVYGTVGLSGNVFVRKKVKSEILHDNQPSVTNIDYVSKPTGINTFELSLIGGFGINYDFGKKLMLKVEPNYRQFIRSISDVNVTGFMYTIGCNVGLYIKL